MEKKRKRLGEILVEEGLIDVYQLQSALAHQKQWGGKLGQILVKLGFLTEEELLGFLSHYFKIPYVNLRKVLIPPSIIKLVPEEVARKYNVLPLAVKEEIGRKNLYLAMADPTNVVAIDELEFALGMPIRPILASDNMIAEAIEYYYGGRGLFKPDPDAVPSNKLNFSVLIRKPGKKGEKKTKQEEESPDDSTIYIFTDGEEKVLSIDGVEDIPEMGGLDQGMNGAGSPKSVQASPRGGQQSKASVETGQSPGMGQVYALLQDINYKLNALAKLLIQKGVITKEEYLTMYRREKAKKGTRQ